MYIPISSKKNLLSLHDKVLEMRNPVACCWAVAVMSILGRKRTNKTDRWTNRWTNVETVTYRVGWTRLRIRKGEQSSKSNSLAEISVGKLGNQHTNIPGKLILLNLVWKRLGEFSFSAPGVFMIWEMVEIFHCDVNKLLPRLYWRNNGFVVNFLGWFPARKDFL